MDTSANGSAVEEFLRMSSGSSDEERSEGEKNPQATKEIGARGSFSIRTTRPPCHAH